ncbi:MAG TPA: SDR family oxidoreductase, partial [Pseudonocardiaceae bacterium]|nr:SDR family oxidoreductase [Pseudonocardiaceae bacterium]
NLRRARLDVPEPDLSRIVAVPGDMGRPRLGLSGYDFDRLSEQADLILHNGAVMNFVLTYRWLMPPHVGSTVEVLRLACRRRATPLHLMSTLGVYLGAAYHRQLITEGDRFDDPTGLDTGYHTTKWVADRLAVNSRERGLPISVHRIAAIVGDTTTGTAKVDSYLSRQVASCVNVGAVPITADVIDMVPVDRLAAAIVALSAQPAGPDRHYYRADGLSYADLGTVLNEAGYPVDVLPYQRWRELILESTDTAFAPLAYGLPAPGRGRYHPRFDCSATWAAAAAAGVHFPPADAIMMRRHIDYLTEAGALGRPRQRTVT